jgi:hypothetical protein
MLSSSFSSPCGRLTAHNWRSNAGSSAQFLANDGVVALGRNITRQAFLDALSQQRLQFLPLLIATRLRGKSRSSAYCLMAAWDANSGAPQIRGRNTK